MKTNKDMRGAAWDALFAGFWLRRLIGATLLMAGIALLTVTLLSNILALLDGGTPLLDEERMKAFHDVSELLAYVGSPAVLPRLSLMALLLLFLSLILSGIYRFGMARLELRAVVEPAAAPPNVPRGWLRDFLSGVTMPLGLAWFHLCCHLRVWWLTLLVVAPCYVLFCVSLAAQQPQPGYLLALPLLAFSLVNLYRYRQAWYLKAVHPDWSAFACLRESRRLMDGRKMRLFSFDCSYWRPFLFVPLLTLALAVFALLGAFFALLCQVVATVLGWGFAAYFGVGQAVFHRELVRADAALAGPDAASAPDADSASSPLA